MSTISLRKTRDFIYQNGLLWERALFAWLFEGGSLHHLYQCLRCYKNVDGGYGHGFEPDIRTPDSYPLALEYLLFILAFYQIPPEDLLFGTTKWVITQQSESGALKNPSSVQHYPHVEKWAQESHIPLSIVGLLHYFKRATPQLLERTQRWAQEHYTLEYIANNDWIFGVYHAAHYFFNIEQFPNLSTYRETIINNIRKLLEAETDSSEGFFQLVSFPDSTITLALPPKLIQRELDHLMDTYQERGHWRGVYDLPHWHVAVTIANLTTLQRYERIDLTPH